MENTTAVKSTETTGTTFDYPNSCFSRLPCGVCTVTGKICPLTPVVIQPTWGTINNVTCDTHT